ncbi:MAG: hypothetical protein AB7D00_11015 [Rhodospirillaceae bacterium]
MPRSLVFGASALGFACLLGCTPSYSPNTYATNAVQQVNKVETGVVIGFRQVMISASGTVGTVTGGAAGGVLGAQSDLVGINSALGAVGGTAVGGILGAAVEHASGDTTGWEYIVRKTNGELLSVTQREANPLPLGQKVLVIAGPQARVVVDYSVDIPEPAAKPPAVETAKPAKPATAPPAVAVETEKPAAPAATDEPAAETPSPVAEAPSPAAPAAVDEQAAQTPPTAAVETPSHGGPLIDNADVSATRAQEQKARATEAAATSESTPPQPAEDAATVPAEPIDAPAAVP